MEGGFTYGLYTLTDEMAAIAKPYYLQRNSGPYKKRAKTRRAIFAAIMGGKCNMCNKPVTDFDNLHAWEFDHIIPNWEGKRLKTAPLVLLGTNYRKPFYISGNACGRRSYYIVLTHATEHTQLLCFQCHKKKTDKEVYNPDYTDITRRVYNKITNHT